MNKFNFVPGQPLPRPTAATDTLTFLGMVFKPSVTMHENYKAEYSDFNVKGWFRVIKPTFPGTTEVPEICFLEPSRLDRNTTFLETYEDGEYYRIELKLAAG